MPFGQTLASQFGQVPDVPFGQRFGFEQSGHFFFNAPVGRGYDDGLVSAIAVLRMMERNPGKSLSQLYGELPVTHATLTMGPYCGDTVKYGVVDELVAKFQKMKADGESVTGQKIVDVLTVNGVRAPS